MSSGLLKHREAKDTYAVDFADDLAVGETLSAPAVTVEKYASRAWADATSEFIAQGTVPAVSGTRVTIELKEAAALAQAEGAYRVEAKATTSTGRIVVGVAPLKVEG